MKQKKASSTIYIIFFLVIFLAFAAFAVDGTIVFTNRIKLQNTAETTVLAAASEFNSSSNQDTVETNVLNAANATFAILQKDGLETAHMDEPKGYVRINTAAKQILINIHMVSEPFFLRFLGVSGIDLDAKACAVSNNLPVTANYAGINWVNPKAVYLSDILSKDLNLNDTAILLPLGNFPSASYDKATGFVKFDLLTDDDNPLSLGPGGFITIKLPAPIVDKTGDDLLIKEAGDAKEGYMVFAGIDNNPQKPYVQNENEGEGISWIDITKRGKSVEEPPINNPLVTVTGTSLTSNPYKIYGSASFDIGACGISVVKYIRIIDDNNESAFVTDGTNYYKVMIYGEASTATAGADIGAVNVLNHVTLMRPSEFIGS